MFYLQFDGLMANAMRRSLQYERKISSCGDLRQKGKAASKRPRSQGSAPVKNGKGNYKSNK